MVFLSFYNFARLLIGPLPELLRNDIAPVIMRGVNQVYIYKSTKFECNFFGPHWNNYLKIRIFVLKSYFLWY